jgi:hypothetical protein
LYQLLWFRVVGELKLVEPETLVKETLPKNEAMKGYLLERRLYVPCIDTEKTAVLSSLPTNSDVIFIAP